MVVHSYSWYGKSESVALELVVDTCTYLNIYPEPVCKETNEENLTENCTFFFKRID